MAYAQAKQLVGDPERMYQSYSSHLTTADLSSTCGGTQHVAIL